MTLFKSLQACTVTAFTLLAGGVANAGSIQTPILFTGSGNQIICVATNATGSPITMTVRIFGVVGNAMDTCTINANDPSGCQVFRNNDSGFCRVSVTGLTNAQVAAQVRAVLMARKTTSPFTIDATVEAR